MQPEDALRVIKRPYVTEKTFDMIEKENKMVFIVDDGASKRVIKEAIEVLYDVDVVKVNTARTVQGKKAHVTFSVETPATDLAAKLGLV